MLFPSYIFKIITVLVMGRLICINIGRLTVKLNLIVSFVINAVLYGLLRENVSKMIKKDKLSVHNNELTSWHVINDKFP